jgi:Ras-related protein Rab-1A
MIKDHDAKKDANEVDIQQSVITTREQRIQRVRARVNKNVQGYQAKDIDANYKIVLIGDAGVGKTSLLLRFADDIFNQNPLSTIGVDFKIKTLKVDNKIVKM